MRSPRIGYGAVYPVPKDNWMQDINHPQSDRHKRESHFIRSFNNYAFEAVKDFGENMARAHNLIQDPRFINKIKAAVLLNISPDRYLWLEGLIEEESNPIVHTSLNDFQKKLRNLLADWADFDIAAVHYAYDFDFLCTEDKGGPSSNSIFGQTFNPTVSGKLAVKILNTLELAIHCWRKFKFPIKSWR